MGNVGVTVFNFPLLGIVVIALLLVALAVFCIVRKKALSPWPFWVLALGLCIVSVAMAVMGNETAVEECLVLAGVAFCAGCAAEMFKK